MELIPLKEEHLLLFPEMLHLMKAHPASFRKLVGQIRVSPAFLLTNGEELIGAAGIIPMWPGVGAAFLLVGPAARTHATAGFLVLRSMLKNLCKHMKLRRVQVEVEITPEAAKLTSLLGFEPEGRLRSYTIDGRDVFMASIIMGDE